MRTARGFIAPYTLGLLLALIGGSAAFLNHRNDNGTTVAAPQADEALDLAVWDTHDSNIFD